MAGGGDLEEKLAAVRRQIDALVARTQGLVEGCSEEETLADLSKIHAAATRLQTMATESLDPARTDVRTLDSQRRHDMRTPLNHILGYSEMLMEDADDRGEADFSAQLKTVRDSGRAILNFFDTVLKPLSAAP